MVPRLLVETMVMTGSDLCASTKPWNLQLDTVEDIYHEFYTQGDREMASGRLPVPIMNRFHRDEQAMHQVTVVWWPILCLLFFAWSCCLCSCLFLVFSGRC